MCVRYSDCVCKEQVGKPVPVVRSAVTPSSYRPVLIPGKDCAVSGFANTDGIAHTWLGCIVDGRSLASEDLGSQISSISSRNGSLPFQHAASESQACRTHRGRVVHMVTHCSSLQSSEILGGHLLGRHSWRSLSMWALLIIRMEATRPSLGYHALRSRGSHHWCISVRP